MSTRFHVTGTPCRAKTPASCPFGESEHFTRQELATRSMESELAFSHPLIRRFAGIDRCQQCGKQGARKGCEWCQSCMDAEQERFQATGRQNPCTICGTHIPEPWNGWCQECTTERHLEWLASKKAS